MNSAHLFSQARLTIVALRVFYCKLQGIKEIAFLFSLLLAGHDIHTEASYPFDMNGVKEVINSRTIPFFLVCLFQEGVFRVFEELVNMNRSRMMYLLRLFSGIPKNFQIADGHLRSPHLSYRLPGKACLNDS